MLHVCGIRSLQDRETDLVLITFQLDILLETLETSSGIVVSGILVRGKSRMSIVDGKN